MRSSVGGSSQDITITFFYLLGNGQEVVIEGEDKVFKDVIEPLESVSVNLVPTSKQNIRDFGPPQQVSSARSVPLECLAHQFPFSLFSV